MKIGTISFPHLILAAFLFGVLLATPAAHAVQPPQKDAADSDKDDSDSASGDMDKDDQDSDDDEDKQTETPAAPVKAHSHPNIPAPAAVQQAAPSAAAKPPSGNWWHPHPGTKWAIQYAGKIDTSLDVAAYDIDLVDTNDEVFKTLHAKGAKIICYFSAGSYEAWRPDAKQFPHSVLGKPNGWKGELWLDIRKIDILKPIMAARIDMAKRKGCDAVDPDNVEGYDNESGFPLSGGDQIAYNRMIAGLAHDASMAVSLKNDVDQAKSLLDDFDFQVNEQCFEYGTCNQLVPFIKANKPVFNIEYKGDAAKICPKANALNFDSLFKKLELTAWVKPCR